MVIKLFWKTSDQALAEALTFNFSRLSLRAGNKLRIEILGGQNPQETSQLLQHETCHWSTSTLAEITYNITNLPSFDAFLVIKYLTMITTVIVFNRAMVVLLLRMWCMPIAVSHLSWCKKLWLLTMGFVCIMFNSESGMNI